jgi:hypothetical protein
MSLGVWEYDRDEEALSAAALISLGRLEPPDLAVEIISSRGDYVTIRIESGALTDPNAILYVETRGTFEILRVEPWPGFGSFLVLRAWPNRP